MIVVELIFNERGEFDMATMEKSSFPHKLGSDRTVAQKEVSKLIYQQWDHRLSYNQHLSPL